jgi:hypothetical protein
MLRSILVAAVVVLLGACTVIKVNRGDSETIEYDGGPEVARDLTTRACHKAGQPSAEIISTQNKDPSLPPGTGRQVTVFKCSPSSQH